MSTVSMADDVVAAAGRALGQGSGKEGVSRKSGRGAGLPTYPFFALTNTASP